MNDNLDPPYNNPNLDLTDYGDEDDIDLTDIDPEPELVVPPDCWCLCTIPFTKFLSAAEDKSPAALLKFKINEVLEVLETDPATGEKLPPPEVKNEVLINYSLSKEYDFLISRFKTHMEKLLGKGNATGSARAVLERVQDQYENSPVKVKFKRDKGKNALTDALGNPISEARWFPRVETLTPSLRSGESDPLKDDDIDF